MEGRVRVRRGRPRITVCKTILIDLNLVVHTEDFVHSITLPSTRKRVWLWLVIAERS
jgi:hypothetical protein